HRGFLRRSTSRAWTRGAAGYGARLTLSDGDIETGLGFIDRAIGREPDRADAHNVRGRLWMAQEQYHRAILSFDRAIELDPSFAWAWNNKGYVHLLTGRYEEAADALETAVGLSPATAYMHNNLGLAYEGIGLQREAEAAFSEALALRPQYVNAMVNMERIRENETAVAEVEGQGPKEREDGSLDFVPGG
ncbi:MAG: tetratricopeptide repeat protein, partial [Myxococcota bacterium]